MVMVACRCLLGSEVLVARRADVSLDGWVLIGGDDHHYDAIDEDKREENIETHPSSHENR